MGSSVAESASTPVGRTADLIAKLEKAEAGSRELDAAIFRLTDARRRQSGYVFPDETPEAARAGKLASHIVAYTTSLDAILALVERELPGWEWLTLFNPLHGDSGCSYAVLTPPGGSGGHSVVHPGNAPALALCAAFLRARSASQPRAPQVERAGSRDNQNSSSKEPGQ